MSDKQRTLKSPISFKGRGLHTGLNVVMTINPAPSNHGIVFRRIDLEEQPTVPALGDFVTDTSRGTTVENGPARVSTIEHVMAALWNNGIDNALVDVNAPEVPIMDGSAREYVAEIERVGTEELDAERVYYVVTEPISYVNQEKGIEINLYPSDEQKMDVHIDYNSHVLGFQYATYEVGKTDYNKEVAPCRTFVFLHELEPLLNLNLIKGGDLDNAIVIVEKPVSEGEFKHLAEIFNKKDIQVTGGYLNNLELRFFNEPARHKLLDLTGDLALLGMRIKGRVMALRPGHTANTELVKIIKRTMRKEGVKPQHRYKSAEEPVYDINEIKRLLPHRPPFLLVDKIIHIDSRSVTGIKNVTMNEPFFVGHFPEEPVMPGVLIVEAMAQCGGILALQSVPDPENYSTYFMKIDGVKFKRKVVPGDTLQFELELAGPIRRGIVEMNARAFVGGRLATEAVLMAQVAKNK